MITPKVKALFEFIEYLHSNIDKFNQYSGLIKELEQLDKQRNQINPRNNYKDKQQYDKIQLQIETKFEILQVNTANKIKDKASELNLCNFYAEPINMFIGLETEINLLKENFNDQDLIEIFKHKSQYLEYRNSTHKSFLSLEFFFDDLDEFVQSLFDYFKDINKNEFVPFKTRAIPVNSFEEVVKSLSEDKRKFILPIHAFNTGYVNEFTLPPIVVNDLEKVKSQVQKFRSKFEKKNFLIQLIEQTYIDKAIVLWSKDCSKCVEQFKFKPAWQGVFAALNGDLNIETAIDKSAYEAGVQYYNNYISFKELLENITNEKILPPQQAEMKKEQETPMEFIVKEYALAYLFDLDTNGKQIPSNQIDGGYSKKELIKVGFELYQLDEKKILFIEPSKRLQNLIETKNKI